jgi:hypothetical protein
MGAGLRCFWGLVWRSWFLGVFYCLFLGDMGDNSYGFFRSLSGCLTYGGIHQLQLYEFPSENGLLFVVPDALAMTSGTTGYFPSSVL